MLTSNEKQEISQFTLGEHLRLAREALNLSLEDVSRQINLRPSILQRLENNEFSHSAISTTYIKGYIRNYAKFLRLPEYIWEPVLLSLSETTRNDLTRGMRVARVVNEGNAHYRWISWVSIIVMVILLTLTALWWWENYQKSSAERDSLVQNYVETQQNSSQNLAMSQENGIEIVPQRIDEEKTPQNNTALLEANVSQPVRAILPNGEENKISLESQPQEATAVQAVNSEVTLQETQEKTSLSLLPDVDKVNATQISSIENQHAGNTSAVQNSGISLAASDNVLSIEVTGATCWIRVRDANRKVLAEKLYKQGEVLNFNQDTVYDLTIGVPSNVKITYKGEAYPLKVDGRVAKFKLQ